MSRYRFRALFALVACYGLAIVAMLSVVGESLSVEGALGHHPLIIVDAGHGGFDGGAEGLSGTVEKDINLPIALKVRDMLELYGFQVLMTRETDTATCKEDLGSISEKKTSDIMNRFEIIKQHPDAIFLSIHQNKYPDSSSFGAQMFYGPQAAQSKLLAEILQQNFVAMLQPENRRQVKEAEDSVYLLYHSPVPSVLIECGFLSNPSDEALLASEEYQNKIAFVVTASLLQYIQQGYYPQVEEEAPGGAPQQEGQLQNAAQFAIDPGKRRLRL